VDIAVAHVNDPVPPLPPAVDKPLGAVVMRLLDKDPKKRPQSADELAELFDRLLARTPPTGVPVVVSEPAPAPLSPVLGAPSVPPPTPSSSGTPAGAPAPATPPALTPVPRAKQPNVPPSFPPARPVRPPMPSHPAARHGVAPPPAPTPESVGRRLGRWRWPVVLAALLVLLLLGALVANQLTGAWSPTPAQPLVAGQDLRVPIVTLSQDRWME
jgi:serine/threonine-protein kinase